MSKYSTRETKIITQVLGGRKFDHDRFNFILALCIDIISLKYHIFEQHKRLKV